jgi:hypothetical protein
MRYRMLPVALAPVVAAGSLGACSLFTDLSGLAEMTGVTPGTDASSSSEAGDAPAAGDAPVLSRYAAAVLEDRPIAYWRLGDAKAPVATDQVGGHAGTYAGTITFGSPGALVGDPDPAARFDGSSGRLDVGSAFAFAETATFSLEVWARPRVVDGSVRFAASGSSRSKASADGYQLYFATDFTLFTRTGAGTTAYAGAAGLAANRYQHLVATYDGAAIRLFVDGTEKGSNPSPQRIGASADTILAFADSASAQFFKLDGELDEIAIYDTALPAARVMAHFRAANGN